MENTEQNTEHDELCKDYEKNHRRGKIFGGLLIVTAGSLFLAKELGVEIPHWVFTWKMFLIAIGLIVAVKHKFVQTGWIVLILVGGAFLLADIYPDLSIRPILWPILIIVFGLFMMFKPRRKHKYSQWKNKMREKRYQYRYHYERDCYTEADSSKEDYLESMTFMGGVKKTILSKNFKGGDITNVFGGAEINLTQADFEKSVTLDITNVFGGTRLIIPAHWEINSELVSVFGSIEDKRPVQPTTSSEPTKTLILRGTTFFGGIDVKSY